MTWRQASARSYLVVPARNLLARLANCILYRGPWLQSLDRSVANLRADLHRCPAASRASTDIRRRRASEHAPPLLRAEAPAPVRLHAASWLQRDDAPGVFGIAQASWPRRTRRRRRGSPERRAPLYCVCARIGVWRQHPLHALSARGKEGRGQVDRDKKERGATFAKEQQDRANRRHILRASTFRDAQRHRMTRHSPPAARRWRLARGDHRRTGRAVDIFSAGAVPRLEKRNQDPALLVHAHPHRAGMGACFAPNLGVHSASYGRTPGVIFCLSGGGLGARPRGPLDKGVSWPYRFAVLVLEAK
jgi:hypothetical protein